MDLKLFAINDWFLLLLLVVTAAYFYLTWNFNYFVSRGIPGPKPVPFFGNNFGLFTKDTFTSDVENVQKYGNLFGFFEGRKPALMVKDPDILRHIFVKSHVNFINRRPPQPNSQMANCMLIHTRDNHWKTMRSTVSPAFSTGKLKLMTQQLNECAQALVDNLAQEAGTGNAFEAKQYCGAFTIDAIASVAFGLKVNSQKQKNDPFVLMAKKVFANPVALFRVLLPSIIPLLRLFGFDTLPKELTEFFTNVIEETAENRGKSGQTRTDFIQLLLNAHKRDDETTEYKEEDKEFNDSYGDVKKKSLSTLEVTAQCILFFLAGYETTATAMSFLMHCLAVNPDIQEKLHEEIEKVTEDKELDQGMLFEMPLLEMCCQESLRMYPPAVRTARLCNNDTKINGLDVPNGMQMVIPIYAIHHDPKIWPEPEKFNPYRFTSEEKAKRGPYDWMPFGAGPRNCIGSRLSLVELKIAMVHIIKNYKLVRSEKTEVPLVLTSRPLMKAKNGIWIALERRK